MMSQAKEEVVRVPQLHRIAGHCRTSAEITHELLNQLEARLEAVMHNEGPQVAEDCAKSADPIVPFASSLANIDSMQRAANDRLSSILNRLEL